MYFWITFDMLPFWLQILLYPFKIFFDIVNGVINLIARETKPKMTESEEVSAIKKNNLNSDENRENVIKLDDDDYHKTC